MIIAQNTRVVNTFLQGLELAFVNFYLNCHSVPYIEKKDLIHVLPFLGFYAILEYIFVMLSDGGFAADERERRCYHRFSAREFSV